MHPYSTTKTCSKCGETKPIGEFHRSKREKDGLSCICKPCNCAHVRAWRDANPEKSKVTSQLYYASHAEMIKRRVAEYQDSRPDETRIIKRRWANKPENKAKKAIAALIYARANPDKVAELNHRRRARLHQVRGQFTAEDWRAVCDAYGNKCLCCGKRGDYRSLTMDHVRPLIAGGWNDSSNIQPLCLSCNSRKQDRVRDYRPDKGRRLFRQGEMHEFGIEIREV